jgi:uncharacterized membrane protein
MTTVRPVWVRPFVGVMFVVVGLINLTANSCWLRTGDIHRPKYHVGMRGGWTGFWITTVLFSSMLLVGLALLVLEWRVRRRSQGGGGS